MLLFVVSRFRLGQVGFSVLTQQLCRYGLAEGALVKLECLGTSGSLELEGAAEVLLEAEGREAAEQVAAAAAEETQDPSEQARNFSLSSQLTAHLNCRAFTLMMSRTIKYALQSAV